MFRSERRSVSAIARELGIDRNTGATLPTQRSMAAVSTHESFLRERAPQVRYSARILDQQLCCHEASAVASMW